MSHCIKNNLHRFYIKNTFNFVGPKKELSFVLPHLDNIWLNLRIRLRQTIERDLPYCKLRVVFRSKCRSNTLFRLEFSLEKKIHSVIIYRYTCSNCRITYYEKVFHYSYTRTTEHMGIPNFTRKRLKTVKKSAIFDNL